MKVKVGMVLLMVLVTAGIAIAMSANANTQKLKLPSELTQEELQKLYEKYGITENDIKFAKRELPNT